MFDFFPVVPVGLQTFHLKTTCSITTLKEEQLNEIQGTTTKELPGTALQLVGSVGATLPDQTSAIHHSAHHPDCGRLPGVSCTTF